MEFIKIGSSAVKITLDPDEARMYDILSGERNGDENEIKDGIKDLLDIAKEKTGIEIHTKRIFVEIYPAKNGGCEIFIGKSEIDDMLSKDSTVFQGKKNTVPICVYGFEKLEELLLACERLKNLQEKIKSEIYYDRELKTYYLVCTGIYGKELKYAFISEYGKQYKQSFCNYVKEHTDCICEKNGIEVFSKFV